jgi:type IX secretion system PorP/SprF family membrane protein
MKIFCNCIENTFFIFLSRVILLLLSFLLISPAVAQISPLYPKYYNYEQFINPAITGRDKSPIVNLSYKQYLFGVKGSPFSTSLGASMRLGTFDFYNPEQMLNRTKFFSRGRMGFGGLLIQDKDGPLSTYFAEFTYAYFVPLNHTNSELSFGLSAQILNYHLNKEALNPLEPNDDIILNANKNSTIPESGCGIYYHDLQFYAGASINDLLLSKSPLDRNKIFPNKRDYFFQSGYKFFLRRFDMEPSLYFAQIDDNPLYFYSQLKFYYMNYNWVSLGFSSTKLLHFSFGVSVKRLFFAYAYEQNISGMSSFYNGSHEIMIGMNIGLYEPLGLRKRTGKK